MRFRRLLATTLGALLFVGTSAIAWASPSEEAEFVSMINQSRAAAGLAPLTVHNDLVVGARNHTAKMIPTGTIFHSTSSELSSVTTGWLVLGENVGKGGTTSSLHRAFMESPSHKANILGDYDRVGVGVGHDDAGKIYVTVMFMKSKAAPAPTTTTTQATTTTTTAPATTTTTTIPASTETASAAPFRPSAPAVARAENPRTLGFGVTGPSWVPGTRCVVVRADGSICAE
ncbi:MAG: CAP domain-containing protein [Acidimicrobiia bacterium]|nr:CAP domain-containing protein [Acidimicrobiia bacterium]